MQKFLASVMALAAGVAVSGMTSSVANAATFAKPNAISAAAATTPAPVVDVGYRSARKYRGFKRRNWRHRTSFRRCNQLRRQALRSNSRWAWSRYRAVCR